MKVRLNFILLAARVCRPARRIEVTVKINIEENCNNAPKKQFVKDFLVAVATEKMNEVAGMLADSASMEIVGAETASGKDSVLERLLPGGDGQGASELIVSNILSHGNKCAADGVLRFGSREVAFCNVYTFTSHSKDAKIKDIVSYQIEKSA